jgi:hypothetical protein
MAIAAVTHAQASNHYVTLPNVFDGEIQANAGICARAAHHVVLNRM